MPQKSVPRPPAQRSGLAPLSSALLVLDPCWAVNPLWGQQVKRHLDTISLQEHQADPRSAISRKAAEKTIGKGKAGYYSGDDDEDDLDDDDDDRPYSVDGNGIATLSLSGPMTKRPSSMSYYYGGTSTVLLRRMLRMAANDDQVKGILLIIDSPGGQVSGTADLAQDVALIGQSKPILTYFEDTGCSAAYWVGSQASAGVYCNLTATVGSVGTLMVLEDSSGAAAEAGVKVYVFGSGKYKGAGTDGAPLTKELQSYFQDYVLRLNEAFTGSVKKARNLTAAQMEGIADAGVYVAQDAVAIGLVDGICTIDEARTMLQNKIGGQGQSSGSTGSNAGLTLNPKQEAHAADPAREATEPAASPPVASMLLPTTALSTRETSLSVPQTHTTPAMSGRGDSKMKERLVRLLGLAGFHKMAVAVVKSTDDSPESLVQTMSEQVKAEVEERVENHPLMLACEAAGIKDPAALGKVLEMKSWGERAVRELRDDAKAQAIRAYGPEMGTTIGATVETISPSQIKVLRDGWSAEADSKFGVGANGEAATRISAPKTLPESVSAEGEPEKVKTDWEKLTKAQQTDAVKMGITNPEKQERFAKEYFAKKAA